MCNFCRVNCSNLCKDWKVQHHTLFAALNQIIYNSLQFTNKDLCFNNLNAVGFLRLSGFQDLDIQQEWLTRSLLGGKLILWTTAINFCQLVLIRKLILNLIRYGFLLLEDVASQDPLSVSVAILHQFNILPEMYQVGYTKLFFRTGQVSCSIYSICWYWPH